MSKKERPPVWIGHVRLQTPMLEDTETFMKQIGLRPLFRGDDIAVMELRGGTHILLARDGSAGATDAKFDFMVEDLDRTHAKFKNQGLNVTDIERGRIHDSFRVTEPGGNSIVVNSTHVPDHDAV
jgi:catechol-2,3-dioxygenase